MDKRINWHNSNGEIKPWTPTINDFVDILRLEFIQTLKRRLKAKNHG